MIKKISFILFIIVISIFITGCSENTPKADNSQVGAGCGVYSPVLYPDSLDNLGTALFGRYEM